MAGTTLGSTGLLAAIALYRGDTASAIAGLEELHAALPDQPAVALTLAGALAAAGHDARADALADALPARFDLSRLSPYVQAIYAVRRRRPDAAAAHLAAAIERRDPLAVQIPDEPAFDPLHPAAGWPALVKRSRRP